MEPKEVCNYSAVKTGNAQIMDETGYFYGIVFTSSADATVKFFDSEDNSGNKFLPDLTFLAAYNKAYCITLAYPIALDKGCYIEASGGTIQYTVLYRKRR